MDWTRRMHARVLSYNRALTHTTHTHTATNIPVYVSLCNVDVPGTLTGDIPLQLLCWTQDRGIHRGRLCQNIIFQPWEVRDKVVGSKRK